jgi:S1-C subfamily serine protease
MAMQDYGGYGAYGGYPPPPPPPRQPSMWRYLAVAVSAAALGAGVVLAIGHNGSSSTPTANSSSPPTPAPSSSSPPPAQAAPTPPAQGPQGGTGLSASDMAIYNKVAPGLVIINDTLNYQSDEAAGTGMVLTSSGLVLTNNHVIQNATSITATVLATGKTYQVKVLGYDVTGDISAIQLVGASGLKTVPLGNSADVKVGDSVLAMGNAEGQSRIVPAPGEVTALDQTINAEDEGSSTGSETLHGMIETNADVVQGDSGGALANSAGQVVGMNTAGNSVSYGYQQAAGFMIPINTALSVVNQITAGQASSTITLGYPAFMGIFIGGTSSSPQSQAQEQNGTGSSGNSGFGGFGGGGFGGGNQGCVTSNANLVVPTDIAPVSTGTLIDGVICNGPAAAAGMTGGSVITAVNGQAVGAPSSLQSIIGQFKPGDTVSVTWDSVSGHSTTSQIQLASGPPA